MRINNKTIKFATTLFVGLFSVVSLSAQQSTDEKSVLDQELRRVDGVNMSSDDYVGAIGVVKADQIDSYADLILTNALQGQVAGLQIISGNSGLGNNSPDIYIRGLHANGNNTAIVVVDGVERAIGDLMPEEIESIEVLKDATAKILFGARAASGVLWVTTRRGTAGDPHIKVTAEAGVCEMSSLPAYLNSAQYAELYNEARANDGLAPFYSEADLEGYRNSAGAHDMLYPDVDQQSMFLENYSQYQRVAVDINGGSDRVRYAVVAGYTGGTGFEDVLYKPSLDRLNLRGNLDAKMNDYFTIVADMAARVEMRKYGQMDCSELFSSIKTQRPNEYPLTLSSEVTGIPEDLENGAPVFGGSKLRPQNVYAINMFGGYNEERYSTNQTNLGVNVNLNKLVKGLTMGAYISFDSYESLKLSLNKTFPNYSVDKYRNANGVDTVVYTKLKDLSVGTDQKRETTTLTRNTTWRTNAAYEYNEGKHNLNAVLAYNYSTISAQGVAQDKINSNTTLRVNYNYDNRYLVELTDAYMGSNRFGAGNKFYNSYAAGAAWVVSNEAFLEDSSVVDFLKLKASYGNLGFDRGTSYFLQEEAWAGGGGFQFGVANNGNQAWLANLITVPNANLKWENSSEFNAGVEASLFGNRLFGEFNYYHEVRRDIVGSVGSSFSNIVGEYVYVDNMGSVMNQGVEAQLTWRDHVGDFNYSISANATRNRNKVLAWNEINHGEEYRATVGKSSDAMMGHQAIGLFGKDVDIASHPQQSFGYYTEGDLAYANLNGDNVIDGRDVEQLGKSFPTLTYGVNIDLEYKGWGLSAYGAGESGASSWATNAFYRNSGESKYSEMALERYHPVNNPNGTYPRLSTIYTDNNHRDSSYWLVDNDFFRLKNLELSYTFNFEKSYAVDRLKLFVRGSNLFVIGEVWGGLDPELINAGVNNYPIVKTYTGGLSCTF